MRNRTMALLAAAICAAGSAGAQESSARPVIRTETRVVLVDTVVTDKKGNYVRDLSAKDFRVWEDNKEQTITSVSFQAEPATPAQRKGYMILLFDNATLDANNQMQAKQAASRLFEMEGAEDRATAIAAFAGTFQILQNFTSDTERLKLAVSRVPPAIGRGRMSGRSESGLMGADASSATQPMGSRGQAAGMSDAADDQMTRSFLITLAALARNVSAVPGRKTLVLFTAGFSVKAHAMGEFNAALNACNRANVALYPVDSRGLGPFRGSLDWGGGAWAGLAGRTGVALAAGPVLGIANFLTAALESGQQAPPGGGGGQAPPGGGGTTPPGGGGTTPPGGGGTTPPGGGTGRGGTGLPGTGTGRVPIPGDTSGRGSTPGQQGPQWDAINRMESIAMDSRATLSALADGTGGFVIRNTNDLLEGLQKIVKEEHEYYLLGYTPPETSKDACHTLRVKVSRGGTAVRFRNSYCFSKPVDILAGTPAERDLQTRLAGAQPGETPASMQAPFFYSAPNTARVNLTMEIPSAGIRFDKVKGKLHAEVNVLAMAYQGEGRIAARSSDVVKLDFDNQAAVDAFKQKPLHYENQFEIAPGRYNLKVAFSQPGGGFGKVESPVVVDPYDGNQFSMSALTLSRQVRQVQDDVSVGLAMIEGRSPLVARNLQYTPSGENRFSQGERFRIYVEMYDPQLLAGASAVTARISTVDRKTGKQMSASDLGNVSAFARPGTNTIAIGLTMPALPPGSYRTELKAAAAGSGEVARTVDFEVQ